MERQEFINRLLEVELKGEKVFEKKLLSDIEKSCCKKCDLEVIDFDRAKNVLRRDGEKTLCSCDCLKIDSGNFDFIEMKSIKQILDNNPTLRNNTEKFEQKIRKFNFADKILDSYYLIANLLKIEYCQFPKIAGECYRKIKKRYIIVFDIDLLENPQDALFYSLDFLGIKNTLEKIIQDEVQGSDLQNIEAPLMKTCTTLKDLYS